MAYSLNYSEDDTRMDEDPPPPHASHPNGTGQRIEPYPRGVYPQPGGYGSYAPSYSYYGQQHHHARGPPPNLVSRAYRDATGNAAGYLNHHWQQPFDVAGEAPPPHHHSQSPRSLAPADLRPSVGGAAGSGRRSSYVALVRSPPMSPTSVKSDDATNSGFGMGGDRSTNGNPVDPLKRFQCMQVGCEAAFARKADRDRHRACVHEKAENKKFPCPESNCSRTGPSAFTRKDHLMEHLRNYHHHDIPKKRRAKEDKESGAWIKEEDMM